MNTIAQRRLPALLLSLCLLLSLLPGLVRPVSADKELSPLAAAIKLPAQEQDEPHLEEMFFGGLASPRYFLLFNGELLVACPESEPLTRLVRECADRYVHEDTIACMLTETDQVQLCYGYVSLFASTDQNAAAQILYQQLKVSTIHMEERQELIPYETIEIEDPSSYIENEPYVARAGVNGIQKVTSFVTCVNGKTVQQSDNEPEILQEPVSEVLFVGTKVNTGFIWPVKGEISSGFGYRNIRVGSHNHEGVDIIAYSGEDVVASQGGTVLFAGRYRGYGNLVEIQHSDGIITRYAHNSSLCVKAGDVVEQGDVIAKAGSTGVSTGPHCHFEILMDGVPVNPVDYLE